MAAHVPKSGVSQDPALAEDTNTTATLCQWIVGLTLEKVPTPVLERAKHLVLDGIACGLVGARVPWSAQAASAVIGFEPVGKCTLIGYEEVRSFHLLLKKILHVTAKSLLTSIKQSLGPLAAAILNGSFIQATELDDYHSMAPLHSAAVVLPALFAAAQVKSGSEDGARVSGRDLLLAAIVGFETGPRSGLAMGGGDLLQRGWHSGPIFGCPAAAAASSKLLDLSTDDTESAIGIACTQAGGLMAAQYEGMIKRVQHAFAARNGLFGALLARTGYVGIKKVFERQYGGFLAMFSEGRKVQPDEPRYDVRKVVAELGDEWHMMQIRVKLHACVGGCHGQIEAIDKLQQAHPQRFALDQLSHITRISVHLSGPIFAHDGWAPHERPLSPTGAQMNAAYIGAVQLVDGQVLLSQFSAASLDRDEVWNLVYKTTCFHDPQFDKAHHGCGARVVVEFDDGETVEETVNMPRGFDPPITDGEIRQKYRRLTASALDLERIGKIEKLVVGLEDVEDVSELLKLVAVPTNRVLG
jgi:aconitate decarboxylase